MVEALAFWIGQALGGFLVLEHEPGVYLSFLLSPWQRGESCRLVASVRVQCHGLRPYERLSLKGDDANTAVSSNTAFGGVCVFVG